MFIYEILVPTSYNDGRFIKTKHHRVFDKKVLEITGGLTIGMPNKGKWISGKKDLFLDRNIPVRIMCSKDQIEDIARFALKHYQQEAIMYYQISSEVTIVNKI